MMRRILSILTNRLNFILLFLLLQVIFIVWIVLRLTQTWIYIHLVSVFLGFLISLYLLSKDENPMHKLSWIILLLVVPVFGVLLYLYSRTEKLPNSITSRMKNFQIIREDELKKIESKESVDNYKQQKYLNNMHFPGYQNTKSKFLGSGEEKQKELLKALNQAKHFIFMEYFIITKSKMWNQILETLIKKQKEGVEVRIIYDDFGSSTKLPLFYYRTLRKKHKFKVVRFNPMKLHINFAMNYRDHRKIVVVDNKIAFTGGINIGDEYLNKKKRFGEWHDAAIMIEGEAVWSFTVFFLENWSFCKKNEVINFDDYKLKHYVENKSLYIPFSDIPSDANLTGKGTILHLINDAKEYVYITAPYLILDNEVATALKLAANSGIIIKIIIPNIPDKKFVYMVSESFVSELINYGIEIYKYLPGFIHSKMIISDGKTAMIGTSNLDFRSLYMHLENNVWLNDEKTILEMVKYYSGTLNQSMKITKDTIRYRNIIYRMIQAILRGMAPLL